MGFIQKSAYFDQLMADLGESAKGTSPSAALRTGRDPLASSGSHQAKLLPTPTFQ